MECHEYDYINMQWGEDRKDQSRYTHHKIHRSVTVSKNHRANNASPRVGRWLTCVIYSYPVYNISHTPSFNIQGGIGLRWLRSIGCGGAMVVENQRDLVRSSSGPVNFGSGVCLISVSAPSESKCQMIQIEKYLYLPRGEGLRHA